MFPTNELYRNSDISFLHLLNLQKLSLISFGSRTFYVMGSWWSSTTCKGESTIGVDANCLQSDISYPPQKIHRYNCFYDIVFHVLIVFLYIKAARILVILMCKHEFDARYQKADDKLYIAQLYFPLIGLVTIFLHNLFFLRIIIWLMIKSRNEHHPFRWYW